MAGCMATCSLRPLSQGNQAIVSATATAAAHAPYVKVAPAPATLHSQPPTRLAGSAATPVSPLNQPIALPLTDLGTMSVIKAFATPSVAAAYTPYTRNKAQAFHACVAVAHPR